jgi:thioredoxin reductase/ferredoxin
MTSSARPRRAELLRPDPDLARGRGIVVGAFAGAAALVLALGLTHGPRSIFSPGPLARPHAGLACASCHEPGTATANCTRCHAAQDSTRAVHGELARRGVLPCERCHALHGHDAALVFEPKGEVTLAGAGFERAVTRVGAQVAEQTTFVPLVAASSCAGCHALGDGRDAAAPCVSPGEPSFSLCFDEHRRPAARAAASRPERDAAIEAARSLFREPSVRGALVPSPGPFRSGAPFALALGLAALVVGVRRRSAATAPANSSRVPRPARAEPRALNTAKLPLIDATRCLGCHACVDACPYPALAVKRYVAVLERPAACCGAGPCEASCPNGSLRLVTRSAPVRGPRLSAELEVPERPGLFVAGDATGGTLIRNAVRQGTSVARVVAERFGPQLRTRAPAPGAIDLLIVGAGPAGLAAGLVAQRLGLSVLLLDQAGMAASIRRFSRQKLVLDAAALSDEKPALWLGDATKEELVERWQHAVRKARLAVREGTRVLEVRRSSDALAYVVRAEQSAGESSEFVARTVLLAVGTRGTPRSLDAPVAEAASPRVHYELSDARAFEGKRCVVVGLGDVAMETAVALAAQPNTEVTLLHRGSGFGRGSPRNIDRVARLAATGRIRLLWEARVTAVRAVSLEIEVAGASRNMNYDAAFVHIGALPARSLLESSGVCLPP